jgi:putative MATE family efflux protein
MAFHVLSSPSTLSAVRRPRTHPCSLVGSFLSPRTASTLVGSACTHVRRSASCPARADATTSTARSLLENHTDGNDVDRLSIDREIASLALPALGALALDPILSLVDTAFIGRLGGAAPIAGLGIASIVLSISFSVFNFLAMATTPLVANAVRSRAIKLSAISQPELIDESSSASSHRGMAQGAASRVITAGFFLSVSIGLASGSFIVLKAPAMCAMLGASPAVLPHAVAYLRARAVVAPVVLVSYVGNGAFRGLKDTRTPFIIAAVANMANLILDPLLIFTFDMGIRGAAVATSVSQVIAVVLMLASLVRNGHLRSEDLRRIPLAGEIIPFLSAGVALTIRTLSILGTVAYATATASTLGTASLAAFEITRQMFVLHAMVLDSIAAAAQAMVSSFLAQGAMVRARVAANRSLQLGAIFGACIGIIAVSLGSALPGLFTSDPEIRSLAVSCIRVASICTPLNGAVFALDGVLAAARDYSFMAVAIAVAGFVAVIALTAVRWAGGGVAAVWGGLNVLMLARAAVLIFRYSSRSSPVTPRRNIMPEKH